MSKEQPDPLRLADALQAEFPGYEVADVSAAELRRLHAENEALQAQIGQGVPVAWKHDCAVLLANDVELWIDACPHCGKPRHHPAPQQKPLTDEQDRALCEAYCNAASDEYFKARPQLDSDVNRRIFGAGHRKAWIEWQAAHNIGEKK